MPWHGELRSFFVCLLVNNTGHARKNTS
jgi:hypothetical protein